ncbi:hypothetical protein [Endozoicomonas sp. 8E]|uniref:hypothetical protein n=1 Tax=Endozoicomonas sp. 8E TaxID=3035692 RepID=UPI002938FD8E|nr:hypothetical protein [Endozoicomonas sp. 8E]WOG25508.1 hypothetical protein P6910_13040 [Endozoicomonas sp. 8E]
MPAAFSAWEFKYSRSLTEYCDEAGTKLKEDSPYQYFLCISKKKNKASTVSKAVSQVMPVPMVAVPISPPSERPDSDNPEIYSGYTEIVITNTLAATSASTSLTVLGAISLNKSHVVVSESELPTQAPPIAIKNALETFRQSAVFSANPDGTPIYFTTSAVQMNSERARAIHEEIGKIVKHLDDLDELNEEIPHWIRRAWLMIRSYYPTFTRFSPVGALFVSVFSPLYTKPLENTFTDYIEQPSYNFTGCRVFVIINTERLIRDMYQQGVLIFDPKNGFPLLTSANTVREFALSANKSVHSFKTKGEFISFSDNSLQCQCPICTKTGRHAASAFGGCLVDGIVLPNVLFVNVIDEVRNRLDAPIGNISEIEMYVHNISDPRLLDRPLKTRLYNFVNFSSFDDTNEKFFGRHSPCQCESCPNVPTKESEASAVLVTFIVNGLVFVAATAIAIACNNGLRRVIIHARER